MNIKLTKSKSLSNLISDGIYWVDYLKERLSNPINDFERYFYLVQSFEEIAKTNSFLYKKLTSNFYNPDKNLHLFIASLSQQNSAVADTKNEYQQLFLEWKQNYLKILSKNNLDEPLIHLDKLDNLMIFGNYSQNSDYVSSDNTENIKTVEYVNEQDLKIKLNELEKEDYILYWRKPTAYENLTLSTIYHFLLAILTKNQKSTTYTIQNSLFCYINNRDFTKEPFRLEELFNLKEILLRYKFTHFTKEVNDLCEFLSQSSNYLKNFDEITRYLEIFMLNYQISSNILNFEDGFFPLDKKIIIVDEIQQNNPFLIQKMPSYANFLQNKQEVIFFIKTNNLELKNKFFDFPIKNIKNNNKITKITQKIDFFEQKEEKNEKKEKNYNIFLKYLNQCSYKAYSYQQIDFLTKEKFRKNSLLRKFAFTKIYNNIWREIKKSENINAFLLNNKLKEIIEIEISQIYKEFPTNFQKKEEDFFYSLIQKNLITELKSRQKFENLQGETFLFNDISLSAGRIDIENHKKILIIYNFSENKQRYIPELLNPNIEGFLIYNIYPALEIKDFSTELKQLKNEIFELTSKNLNLYKSPKPSSNDAFICENCFARIICKNPKI